MGLRRKILGGGGMLMAGQVLGQACGFLRNVIVARLLEPEDFGIAATLSIAMSMLEMLSNLAVDRLLVQAEDGDEPVFQATAQLFQVIRGVGLALSLLLLAWPFSLLFDLPQALWAFQCVALVPLIRGFSHLDSKRLQRKLSFGADVATDLLPQVVLVLAAWPFAWWFEDYSAMVWLLIFQSMTMVAVSHVVAKRRYVWAWNRQVLDRMCAFGWPLLFNGVLMFFIMQGDRIIIGSTFNMSQLGIYSAAFTTTFIPSTMVAKVTSALILPLLSNHQADSKKFDDYYARSICILCLVGIAVATGFILLGEKVVHLAYGAKYSGVEAYIGWLATMQMVRVLRVGPTIASMASGDTRALLLSNIGRISVFPAAIWMGMTGMQLKWIVIMGCVGELLALLQMVRRLHRAHGLAAGHTLKPMMIGAAAISIAFGVSGSTGSWTFFLVVLFLILAGAFGIMVYWFRIFRSSVFNLLQDQFPISSRK